MPPRVLPTRKPVTILPGSGAVTPPQVQLAPLRRLRPSGRNARTHSKKQIRQIANSIAALGWAFPILTDEAYIVIAGHGRLEAAKVLRLRDVPVIVMTGLSEVQKRALALADNKIAGNAGYNRAMLAAELGDLAVLLPEIDLSLDITGFETPEVDGILGDLSDPDLDPIDAVPQPHDTAISVPGDIWQCGNHRILCGDALDPASYEKLMRSERASLTIADAPYNVRIKDVQGRGSIKHSEFLQTSGEKSRGQFTDLIAGAMGLAAKYSIDGSLGFWFMDWRHQIEIMTAGERTYGPLVNLIVWTKTNAGQGSFYRSQHELIYLFKKGGDAHINNVELGKHGRNRSNVWQYAGVNSFRADRLAELRMHPTVKPVALVADAMRDCSRRGDIVLDPFWGPAPSFSLPSGRPARLRH